jgi:hypothetical protein
LPIAGPKVKAVDWPAADHAQLAMTGFPMDSMPPFARNKFVEDLQSSVRNAMDAHHIAGPVKIDVIDAASGAVMQTVTVAGEGSPPSASKSTSASSAPGAGAPDETAAPQAGAGQAASSGAGGFPGALANAIRAIPFAGNKVQSIEWSGSDHARIMMNNFPMDQMPPFARAKFLGDLKAGIQSAKSANRVSGPVQVDIADASTGRVMDSVTQ